MRVHVVSSGGLQIVDLREWLRRQAEPLTAVARFVFIVGSILTAVWFGGRFLLDSKFEEFGKHLDPKFQGVQKQLDGVRSVLNREIIPIINKWREDQDNPKILPIAALQEQLRDTRFRVKAQETKLEGQKAELAKLTTTDSELRATIEKTRNEQVTRLAQLTEIGSRQAQLLQEYSKVHAAVDRGDKRMTDVQEQIASLSVESGLLRVQNHFLGTLVREGSKLLTASGIVESVDAGLIRLFDPWLKVSRTFVIKVAPRIEAYGNFGEARSVTLEDVKPGIGVTVGYEISPTKAEIVRRIGTSDTQTITYSPTR